MDRAVRDALLLLFGLLVAQNFYALPALGATLFVHPTMGSDSSDCLSENVPCLTLNQTVSKASNGDIISLLAGTYIGPMNRAILLSNRNLIIQGAGSSSTIFDAQSAGRIFWIDDSSNVQIRSLTIRNGFSGNETVGRSAVAAGGGLIIRGSSTVSISDCVIRNCVVPPFEGGTVGIAVGGGLYSDSATILINNVEFIENFAGSAGAICTQGSSNVTITNTKFLFNTVRGWGGAIVPEEQSRMTIRDSYFEGNYAECCGGAIDDGGTAVWSVENTVFRNHSAYLGGSFYFFGDGTQDFNNITVIDSSARDSGGLLHIGSSKSTGTFRNSRFFGLVAKEGALSRGGADTTLSFLGCIVENSTSGNVLQDFRSRFTIKNSIFRYNRAGAHIAGVGAYNRDPVPVVENIVFHDNYAERSSIMRFGNSDTLPAPVVFRDIVFRNNLSPRGIVMVESGKTYVIFDGLVCEGNSANRGGCITVIDSGELAVRNAVIQNNRAVFGGAFAIESSGKLNVERSAIRHNVATIGGGVARLDADAQLSLLNSVMEHNRAHNGGAFYFDSSASQCVRLSADSSVLNSTSTSAGGFAFFSRRSKLYGCSNMTDFCSACTIRDSSSFNGDLFSSEASYLSVASALQTNYSSSERFSVSLNVYDAFDNPIKVRDYVGLVSARLRLDNGTLIPTLLGGITTADFQINKPAVLDQLSLNARPGSTLELTFTTEPPTSAVVRAVSVRDCETGTLLYQDDLGRFYCLRIVDIAFASSVVLSLIGIFGIILAAVLLVLVMIYRHESVIRKSSSTFSATICVGCILMFAAVIAFAWTSRGACALRPWLLSVGFGLVYGSLFIKNWRMWRVFSADMSVMLTITDISLFRSLSIFVGVQLVVLIIWFSLSPLTAVSKSDLVTQTITYSCGSNTAGDVLFWILLGLCYVLLVAGCFVAYKTRGIPTNFNESKFIAFAIYNVTLASIVSIGIAAGLPEPNVIAVSTTLGTWFTTLVTLLTLLLPKFRYVFFMEAMQESLRSQQEKLRQDVMWIGRQLDELRNKSRRDASTTVSANETSYSAGLSNSGALTSSAVSDTKSANSS